MRHSVRAHLLPALLCCVTALGLPASALASGGLHIDPASPVAKEYALPLASARGAPPESGQTGKLFGSGITRATAHSNGAASQPVAPSPPPSASEPQPTSTVTTTTTTTTQTTASPRHHRPARVTTAPAPSVPRSSSTETASATPVAYRVLRPGSGSGLLWMALAAVVVVALGSAGGLVLSRRR